MKNSIALVLCAMLVAGTLKAQDEGRILDQLRQMESRLQSMIEKERTERERSFGELRKLVESSPKEEQSRTVAPSNDADSLITILRSGNEHFVSGKLEARDFPAARVPLVAGQQPFAIILTCADSRVPPEYIFDQSLGRLFVVRVAGNVLDSVTIGSIEYAAEHLHTHLLLVLGHEKCGAVKAACDGGTVPPFIGSITRRIAPSVKRARAGNPPDVVSAAVLENVKDQVRASLTQSKILRELAAEGHFSVQGGVYDLQSGAVRFLDGDSSKSLKAVEAIRAFRETQEKELGKK